MNKSGESKCPCIVPNCKGNNFSFFLLSMMLAMGLSFMACIMLMYVSSILTSLRVFIINRYKNPQQNIGKTDQAIH